MTQKKIYGIAKAVSTSKVHPGYSSSKTAEENVETGVRYWSKHKKQLHGEEMYLKIAHELNALCRLTHKKAFCNGFEIAMRKHDKEAI